jgi:DNA polymerase/3'-5' exonuclease PolX
LTPQQTIELKYYDEFQEKISREEVEKIAEIVQQITSTIKGGFIFQICGSYRRGRDLCGDVDLLMTHPDGHSNETILKPLLERLHDMSQFCLFELYLLHFHFRFTNFFIY